MEIRRESGRFTRTLPRSKGQRRAGGERLLRAVEWLAWPKIWIPPRELLDDASVSPHRVPWVPTLEGLSSGLYAVGPTPADVRALPVGFTRDDAGSWREYVARPISSVLALRVFRVDEQACRTTGEAAQASRKFPKIFPQLVADPEAWRQEVFERIASVRARLDDLEAVTRGGWNTSSAKRLVTDAVVLSTHVDDGSVRLAEPDDRWWKRWFRDASIAGGTMFHRPLALVLSRCPGTAGELRGYLDVLGAAQIPVVAEGLFLTWLHSGGSAEAVRGALHDFAGTAHDLGPDHVDPVPEELRTKKLEKSAASRQRERVTWIGAMHGLAPGNGATFASWLLESEVKVWDDGRPSLSVGEWLDACRLARNKGLRLAAGLGHEEPDILRTVLSVFPRELRRREQFRDNQVDRAVALARSGLDAEVVRIGCGWWIDELLHRQPEALGRLLRHPWFGAEAVGLGLCYYEDILSLPARSLDWILELPLRLMAARPPHRPAPEELGSSAERSVILQILEFVEEDDAKRSRRDFLLRHQRSVGSELVRRWRDLPGKEPDAENDEQRARKQQGWIANVQAALTVAHFWELNGFEDGRAILTSLLDSPPDDADWDPEMVFPAVALSQGDPGRLYDLLAHLVSYEEKLEETWWALDACERVRRALLEQPPSKLKETISRLADLTSLREIVGDRFRSVVTGEQEAGTLEPAWVPLRDMMPECEDDLLRLQWLQRDAAQGVGPTRALTRALRRNGPDGDGRHLERRLAATLRALELERISRLVDQLFREKISQWIGEELPALAVVDESWRHAVRLGATLGDNRRTMKRLLRAEHQGESEQWIRAHPENVRFLEQFERAGGDAERWLAGFRERRIILGRRLEIHVEDSPLEVLRMGTIFGTCLSQGDFNAHAAVANAVDLNKRVIYVRHRGKIIARKLVAVVFREDDAQTECPLLVGYRLYGSPPGGANDEGREALRRAVNSACGRWAHTCGMEIGFAPSTDPNKLIAKEWYDDGQVDWDEGSTSGRSPTSDRPRRSSTLLPAARSGGRSVSSAHDGLP